MNEIAERFWKLCREADEAFQGEGDVRPSLSRVLRQSSPHPKHAANSFNASQN